MPTSCLTGCGASLCCKSTKRKAGDGPRRITPQWDLQTAKECARDVEAVLSSDSYPFFLDAMYGDMPNNWSPELRGWEDCVYHQRFYPYAFCFPNGQLDMYSKESPEEALPH